MKKLTASIVFMTIIASLFVSKNLSLSHMLSSEPKPVPIVASTADAAEIVLDESERKAPMTFEQQIDAWIQHLANKDEHMKRWKDATWHKQPLGPGQHSWLILLEHEGEDVGYLVVASVENDDSLRLIEYGTGPYPLYSQRTLNRTLLQHHLLADEQMDSHAASKRYYGPLQSVWEINDGDQIVTFDAITGEMYPPDLTWPEATGFVRERIAMPSSEIEQQLHLTPFDPFEKLNWIDNAFIDISVPGELVRMLHSPEQLTYTAHIFNERLTIPFAVSGYHLWSDQALYVCLEYDGKRFISFPELLHFGEFYPERD